MTNLVPLHFGDADVRMIISQGEPWWVLSDVCAVLDIAGPRNVAKRLEDYQKGVHSVYTLGGQQEVTVVNEAGVYAVTLNSRKDGARAFAQWLFTEVLPSIRKFGMYPPPPVALAADNDWTDGMAKTVGMRFAEERQRWEALTGCRFAQAPGFSDAIIRAIEADHGGLRKRDRPSTVALAGMDVLYILTGRRTISLQERRVIDYIRGMDDPAMLALPDD